jgi:hypothetical protein
MFSEAARALKSKVYPARSFFVMILSVMRPV